MFRAEMLWLANGPTLKMEGKLVDEWAEQARCMVTADVVPKGLIVDLTEVSYIDSAGEHLLSWLGSVGAVFAARGVYTTDICKRLGPSPMQRIRVRRYGSKEKKSSIIPMQVDCRSGAAPQKEGMMSWFHASTTATDARNHAPAAEIVACFRDQGNLLDRLAFLITADRATAEQAVTQAREITLQGNSPLRNWLLEWAKAATIARAISFQRLATRACAAMYKERRCPHVDHLCHLDNEGRAASLALILPMDAQKIIAELDPLCRAILVLRIAVRSSIQDCSLRLNVSRAAVLAANCLAMTWLDYQHMKPLEDDHNALHAL